MINDNSQLASFLRRKRLAQTFDFLFAAVERIIQNKQEFIEVAENNGFLACRGGQLMCLGEMMNSCSKSNDL